jgi:hypothetical protein
MQDSGIWDVISGEDAGQIVLGVDFPRLGRRTAGFAELAAGIGPEYTFLQTRLPSGLRFSGEEYVQHWVDELRGRPPVLAVLGYRIGSVYAAAIAEGISRWQQKPRVILFDPQFASSKLLGRELRREIDAISSLLSDDEIEHAMKLAGEISCSEGDGSDGSDGVEDAAATVTGIYWDISSVVFDRVGLGGACCSKMFAPFEAYISLISMADQIDPGHALQHSTAIVSSDYTDSAVAGSHLIPFDVSNADLLRSASVAKTVLDLLEFR